MRKNRAMPATRRAIYDIEDMLSMKSDRSLASKRICLGYQVDVVHKKRASFVDDE